MTTPERKLIRLSGVEPSRIEYLWGDRIPLGALTVLDADPGAGKSSVARDLAARITTGRQLPFVEGVSPPAGVVLLQPEDDLAATIRPALDAARADVSRVIVYDATASGPLLLPENAVDIERAVREVDARLVVIDPITELLSGSINSDQAVRRALRPLVSIAKRNRCAVVLVRHLTKRVGANPLYRGAGSIGVIGLARAGLFIGRDPTCQDNHQHVLAVSKGSTSHAPSLSYRTVKQASGAITIEWSGISEAAAEDVIAGESKEQRSALDEACYLLCCVLRHGPAPAKAVRKVAAEALVASRTLTRAKGALNVQSRKMGQGGWWWELVADEDMLRPYIEREQHDDTWAQHLAESVRSDAEQWEDDEDDDEDPQ